ncbi:MAG: hypothetical protein ACI9H8_002318 [Lysobacterales bacterium]|jgi:hypothetical protein
MNKKFIISVVVVFVVSMLLGFITHAWALADEYAATGLYRTLEDQEAHFVWMLVAHVIMAYAFVKLYVCGREDKPWLAQGLRFGFLIGLFAAVGIYMIFYAVQPLPEMLVFRQAVYDTLNLMVLGSVVAWMYR